MDTFAIVKAGGSVPSDLHEKTVQREAYELAVHREAKELELTDGDAENLIDNTVKDYFPATFVKPDFSK